MSAPPAASATTDRAFDRVFRAEYGKVVGIAARVLGDRARAEDVAQDAFLALHRRQCSEQAWAGGWVCAAAAHMALNTLRSDRRRGRREQLALAATEAVDPAVAVERADDGRLLRTALGRLSQRAATVLVLRHSGLSYAEVAAAMDVRQGDVGTMLRRAESALRKEVDRAASQ
ncbi:MAG: sigma-70 family RNA polymerase sigma factor [Candidatus Dormibacteraeota bacterium]|uniref:RNA polymerase subunit sigma-24 n=1 Tax=Candidatus Aeolococcus gillhamiae TaxID=3127015 RepID=A0A2W5ZAF2_9BACT|nr:sigma-70 family RNA polymerase sigma factor [Candidatus Dormibacteraeota bacterium]PZR82379.1 MAG: RNA polymerase subunit sigma-24 [Candidatus Dormibacter sp. RRmetagenome_bin12]